MPFPSVDIVIENPKDSIRKLLEIIRELAKLQDTKSTHRNHLHVYILTGKNQKAKLRNKSHSPLQQKEKNLGINLPKETKQLYTAN